MLHNKPDMGVNENCPSLAFFCWKLMTMPMMFPKAELLAVWVMGAVQGLVLSMAHPHLPTRGSSSQHTGSRTLMECMEHHHQQRRKHMVSDH
jgi:hypothetical protein